MKDIIEYIKWWFTDRGKYTYWSKIGKIETWDENPIVIKDKEFKKLWKKFKD